MRTSILVLLLCVATSVGAQHRKPHIKPDPVAQRWHDRLAAIDNAILPDEDIWRISRDTNAVLAIERSIAASDRIGAEARSVVEHKVMLLDSASDEIGPYRIGKLAYTSDEDGKTYRFYVLAFKNRNSDWIMRHYTDSVKLEEDIHLRMKWITAK